MNKASFLMLFGFTVIFTVFSQETRISYWHMDVTINDVQQTAYFFRNLSDMNSVTGFPHGNFKSSYNWVQPLYNIPQYYNDIYSYMRRNELYAAFVLWGTGTNIHGEPYWMYRVFILHNGTEYNDGITRTNMPVRF